MILFTLQEVGFTIPTSANTGISAANQGPSAAAKA
jgi:hypothetical protein